MSKLKIHDVSTLNTDTNYCDYLITPDLDIIINSSKSLNLKKDRERIQRISTNKAIEYSTDEYMRLGIYSGFKYYLEERLSSILDDNENVDDKTLDNMVSILLDTIMLQYSNLLSCFGTYNRKKEETKLLKTQQKTEERIYQDILKNARVSNIRL